MAITRVIPIVGPILGGIPIVLLATAQSWQLGISVLIFFTTLHLFESKILMPKLIGYQIHLHPAIIIIVLLIGSEFFGLMGMFLAVPVAATVKILVNYYVIRPRLVGDEGMPAILTFLALFGGLEVLGLPGLIAGPVIMALAVAVLRLYAREVRRGKTS